MRFYRLLIYLLLIIIPLYFLQGILYPTGSLLSQGLIASWFIIDIIFLLKYSIKPYKDEVAGVIILFCLMNTLYWLFSEKTIGVIATITDLKNILVAFLTYFPFRHICKGNVINRNQFIIFLICLFVVFILSFYKNQYFLLEQASTDILGVTNNSAYKFVIMLPIISFLLPKNKILYGLLYIISLYLVIQGAKRGAILCLILQTLLMLIYFFRTSHKHFVRNIVFIAMFLTIVIIAVNYVYESNEYLQYRITDMMSGTDDSGDARIDQYSAITSAVFNGPLLNFIFGYGFDQTLSIAGNYAHNDWFELVANMGMLGVIIYLSFFSRLIWIYYKYRKKFDPEDKLMFFAALGIWLLRSMFSMSYLYMDTFLLIVVFAYIQSKIEFKLISNL